jgi:hypothetical protein
MHSEMLVGCECDYTRHGATMVTESRRICVLSGTICDEIHWNFTSRATDLGGGLGLVHSYWGGLLVPTQAQFDLLMEFNTHDKSSCADWSRN